MTLEVQETSGRCAFRIVPTLQYNISCIGWENSIAQCTFEDLFGNVLCDHPKDMFINCARKESCRYVKATCILAVF